MTFTIELQPSGHEFETIGEETLLDAAFREGMNLAHSCQNGSCGECHAKLLSGEVKRLKFHDFALSEAEKIQNTLLMCCYQATSDCVIEANEAKNAADIPRQSVNVKVAKIDSMDGGYINLQLRTPRTKTLRFLAGQKIKISLAGVAPFYASIASCPCNGMILQIHLYKNDKHEFSKYVFNEMKPGDMLTIEGPEGHLTLDEDSTRPIVMVGVDTGYAPLKSIIEHAIALDLQQAIHLYWLTTDGHQHYQENYCRSWEYALETFLYQPMTIAASEGALSHVIKEVIARSPIESELDVYLAGPENIVNGLQHAFEKNGTPPSRIFKEPTNKGFFSITQDV